MPLGTSIQGITNFIVSNTVAIITIIITVIGIVGTPYYIRNRINSAREERYTQAKNSLLNILEDHVINDKDLSEDRLSHLLSAIERSYSVSIANRITRIELLQDLLLRIEESKLDTGDKEKYSSEVEDIIQDFREEQRIDDLPMEYQLALQELEESDNISPESIVDELEEARNERRRDSSNSMIEITSSVLLNPKRLNELPPRERKRVLFLMLVIAMIYSFMFMYYFLP